jgi:probable rRNA maturation factor
MPFRLSILRGPHEGVSRRDLRIRIEAMMQARQIDNDEVSFLLTDDIQIHKLNLQYRGFDKPTDVLAFALSEGEFGGVATGLLGDVVVSVPTARRQARAARRPLVSELTMLLAHGLLHLLGYDHQTLKEDRVMRRETERLCEAAEAAAAPAPAPAQKPPTRTKKRREPAAIAQRSGTRRPRAPLNG